MIYRIKTETEFIEEYGEEWRYPPTNVGHPFIPEMDYLFGTEVKGNYNHEIQRKDGGVWLIEPWMITDKPLPEEKKDRCRDCEYYNPISETIGKCTRSDTNRNELTSPDFSCFMFDPKKRTEEEKDPTTLDPKSTYYDAGGIEVMNIIQAKLTPEQFEGYCLGNIIKYSCRANFKENFDRDIEKIGVYQKKLQEAHNDKPMD